MKVDLVSLNSLYNILGNPPIVWNLECSDEGVIISMENLKMNKLISVTFKSFSKVCLRLIDTDNPDAAKENNYDTFYKDQLNRFYTDMILVMKELEIPFVAYPPKVLQFYENNAFTEMTTGFNKISTIVIGGK